MESFKIEDTFSLKDFNKIQKIEESYFEKDEVIPAKEIFRWYNQNNKICIGVRNQAGDIIASLNILPLKKEVFDNICKKDIDKTKISYTDIEKYEKNKYYYLYFSSIQIDEKYRNNFIVLKKLIIGGLLLFEKLHKDNISIVKVVADVTTPYGEKICKKLFNMNKVLTEDNNSKLYYEDGENFEENLNSLIKLYLKK